MRWSNPFVEQGLAEKFGSPMWKTWTAIRNIASHIADLRLACDRKSGALRDDAMGVNGFRCAVRRCRGSSESGSARAGDLAPSN